MWSKPNLMRGGAAAVATLRLLNGLLADQVFELVQLDADAMVHFENLVIGPAVATLDDGEAATIAYSITRGATAAIDERKATTICSQRFPALSVWSTVDILARPDVQNSLGKDELSAAVFRALMHGRMRGLPHNVQWVVELTGLNRLQPASASRRLPVVCGPVSDGMSSMEHRIGRQIGTVYAPEEDHYQELSQLQNPSM
jgi:hypothetical protein